MRKSLFILTLLFLYSCNQRSTHSGRQTITVTIAPYSFFIREIAGDDFRINIMVPSGSNPHIYEPYPRQIAGLRESAAYITNGFLGVEMSWMDRFKEINRTMKIVSVGEKIEPIASAHVHEDESDHDEAVDPHYWISPKCAIIIARSVMDLVGELNPGKRDNYEENYEDLVQKINDIDRKAKTLFAGLKERSFMIYHPNLAYLARDYGLVEIPVEFEGKEPPPSRLRELIDIAERENINTIFVQKEFDTRNAKTIADEVGAEIKVIDPLSEEWLDSTEDIINGLYLSLSGNEK